MAKKNFIFQTGHGKGLARAEILILFPESILDEVHDGFVVEAEIEDAKETLKQMGSIVRITEILQQGPSRMPLNFESWVMNALENEVVDLSGKIRYGLSMHPKSDKALKKTLIGSKKKLKEKLGNLRFVNKEFQNLSSVQAWHAGLLSDKAIELHLFKSEDKWYLSKTLAIQNFEWYSTRDYDRPAKSAKNGMFPPKLAQILINLAEAKEMVFDPFCGSGTVLQEAWLKGLKSKGSDLSEQMISDSKENLEWLKAEMKTEEEIPRLFLADATKLTTDQLPPYPFTIVTETWLGPMLEKNLTALERPKVQREVEALYEAFFSNFKEIVDEPVTMIFTAPYHREGNDRHFMPNLPAILEKYTEILPLSEHERPSLFYERKNQFVSREIWKVIIKK